MKIWNNTNIILHSRDIRKCQNGFEVHVLNPDGVNLAYDVLKKNIFQVDGKMYGMKVFPKEIKKELPMATLYRPGTPQS